MAKLDRDAGLITRNTEAEADLKYGIDGGSSLDASDLEVLVVSRAVDDGDIYSSATVVSHSEDANVHKMSDAVRQTNRKVAEALHSISDTVKLGASTVTHDVKAKTTEVTDGIKHSVGTMNSKVKANPYLFAAGAVGAGFLIGRLFLAYREREQKKAWPEFQATRTHPSDHTGIHLRPEKSYASGSGI